MVLLAVVCVVFAGRKFQAQGRKQVIVGHRKLDLCCRDSDHSGFAEEEEEKKNCANDDDDDDDDGAA